MFLSVSMTACRMAHFPAVNNGIQIRGKIIFFQSDNQARVSIRAMHIEERRKKT